jgi:uncharacterized membrane protein YphA (DoxX/SURF4 family)
MRITATIARYLLGLLFTVFGLNGFLHFLPMKMPASATAIEYLTALSASGYFVPVYALQVAGGLLLLAGLYVPLALTLLGPVVVNILLYHGLMDRAGIAPGLLAALLWLVVFLSVRANFRGLFAARPLPAAE